MAFTAKGHFPFCYGDDGGTVLLTGGVAGIGSGKPFPVQLTLREAWEWFWKVREWDYDIEAGFDVDDGGTCTNPSPPPADLSYTRSRVGNATLVGTLSLGPGRDGVTPDEQRRLLCCTNGIGSPCHAMADSDTPGGTGWAITFTESACGTDSSGSYSSGAISLDLFVGGDEYAQHAAVVWPSRAADQVYPHIFLGLSFAGDVPIVVSSLQESGYVSAGSVTIDGYTLPMYGPPGTTITGTITRGTLW